MGTSPRDIRNISLVGHADAGKTTLADWIAHTAGASQRRGSVKEKTSIFDFDDLERDKQHTIDSALARFEHGGKTYNLVDTPGYPDFIGDAICAISATDSAVLCINALNGVQVNSRRTMEAAEGLNRARMIVVTKCDLPDIDFDKLMADIQEWFGKKCVPMNLPVGFGADISGTQSVLADKGASSDVAKAHYDAFVEAAVEVDDEAMMKYLEGEEIDDDTLNGLFPRAVAAGTVIPVVFTSAEKDIGMEKLLEAFSTLLPGADATERRMFESADAEDEGEVIPPDPSAPFRGQVFKIQVDKHVGKVSYLRVYTGTIKNGDSFVNASGGRKERVGHIMYPVGKDLEQTEAGTAGEIIALTKIDSLKIGDSIAQEGSKFFRKIPLPRPMAQLAVSPKSRNDETKISEALTKLAEEIPTFEVHREAATREQIASGMSQLQLDVAFRRLKDRFNIEVETRTARMPYKECVTVVAKGHYRHKKQSGGRGQFGEVYLTVSPGEPGSGLNYEWKIVGGSIPSNFAPAIEKGIKEKMTGGVIAGYPIEDIAVRVTDGKFHDVDSSEAAFKMAGGRAFAEAVQTARPVLLEPMVDAEILVPAAAMGDISGDLNTRRGRIMGMEAKGPFQVIKARAPKAEMTDYTRIITSLTSGEGSFTYEECGYEQVPANVQAEIVAQFKPKVDDD